jgi:hypothetical protein
MKSVKSWVRTLLSNVRAGETPPPFLLTAFVENYLQLAEHMDRDREAAALFMEARATAMETRHKGDEATTAESRALRIAAHDIRHGLHLMDEPPVRRTHVHSSGTLVEALNSSILVMDEETGSWEQGWAYRDLAGPDTGVLKIALTQRWEDEFVPVEDPDV